MVSVGEDKLWEKPERIWIVYPGQKKSAEIISS